MGDIIDFKTKKKIGSVPFTVIEKQIYGCAECNNISFMLCSDGTVHCALCKAYHDKATVIFDLN